MSSILFSLRSFLLCRSLKVAQDTVSADTEDEIVARLFYHLIRSEHSHVLNILKQRPSLIFQRSDIEDIGGNFHADISIYKYAAWSLDLEMCSALGETFPEYASYFEGEVATNFYFDLGPYIKSVEDLVKSCINGNAKDYASNYASYFDERARLPGSILQAISNAELDFKADSYSTWRKPTVRKFPPMLGFNYDFLLGEVSLPLARRYRNMGDLFLADSLNVHRVLISFNPLVIQDELDWLKRFLKNRLSLLENYRVEEKKLSAVRIGSV